MSLRIQADVVIANSQQVLTPGQVLVRHGRILEVTDRLDRTADVRLDGMAIVPGLVNPHTHLEFCDLEHPLPAGENFPQWISQVLAVRQSRTGPVPQSVSDSPAALSLTKPQAILRGLVESRKFGVAALADIVTPPWSPSEFENTSSYEDLAWQLPKDRLTPAEHSLYQEHMHGCELPKVIACIEQLGLSSERMLQAQQWRYQVLAIPSSQWPTWLMQLAFSPHAPYSTPEQLWQSTSTQAAASQCLIAMHLAESAAERQWLDQGTGPMAEMLERFGVPSIPQPKLIPSILDALAAAPRGLVIHGNYLTTSEIDHLSRYRDRLRVVYCPRTHRHFGHQPYPLDEFKSRGISVILGTDSRSTNPDLNLWSEAVEALAQHPTLRPSEALAAITTDAALALGIDDHYGSLRPGAVAQLNFLSLTDLATDREDLIQSIITAAAGV